VIAAGVAPTTVHAQAIPDEPLVIGAAPQYVHDRHVVDNHWGIKFKREGMQRVLHQPRKHDANPVLNAGGYCNAVYDDKAGVYRLWYQTHNPDWRSMPGHAKYAVAYAESPDGLNWTQPSLGLHEWRGSTDNNIVWMGANGAGAKTGLVLDLPDDAKRGHRYVMSYSGTDGMHLIGSDDGIHWKPESDLIIKHRYHSDTYNNIVFDPDRQRFIMYCRARHMYRHMKGEMIDTGASRRIAAMTNDTLWSPWTQDPRTIMVADEIDLARDYTLLYGMTVTRRGPLYLGLLWPFKLNTDIHTELVTSRDGLDFQRLPGRPPLIPLGPDGAWDDGMTFGTQWIEQGNEWWLYYSAFDGPHESRERQAGIGLARVRKDGFLSMRGPANGGGVVCTRTLVWPGGDLVLNADAASHEGRLTVRVSGPHRELIDGYDHGDMQPLTGNSTDARVRWGDRGLDELKGQTIRLEFFLEAADLFTFRAHDGALPDGSVDPLAVSTPVPLGPARPLADYVPDGRSDDHAELIDEGPESFGQANPTGEAAE